MTISSAWIELFSNSIIIEETFLRQTQHEPTNITGSPASLRQNIVSSATQTSEDNFQTYPKSSQLDQTLTFDAQV